AKARNWGALKTVVLTILCGIGHIMSSVIIGLLGVIFGIEVMKLKALESFRGNIAGWLLIIFGFTYLVWGIYRAIKNRSHEHIHAHVDLKEHLHTHSHNKEHVHLHTGKAKVNITSWILFTIFVFGPCEPLIPILMYPAAKNSSVGVMLVATIFGIITILTMLTIVMASYFGLKLVNFGRMERYSHAFAGASIFLCGVAVQFLGL
ncbi:MAG: hypothetical protein CO035_07365, partial [Candidatus Omnitrophica bacterium CG_4_9_14_0_2_um_filter_42_8]